MNNLQKEIKRINDITMPKIMKKLTKTDEEYRAYAKTNEGRYIIDNIIPQCTYMSKYAGFIKSKNISENGKEFLKWVSAHRELPYQRDGYILEKPIDFIENPEKTSIDAKDKDKNSNTDIPN
jgi:hypothetical protein